MTFTQFGRHKKEYLMQIKNWAKHLGAEDVTVYEDHSVTLTCKDGYICYREHPTAKELAKKYDPYKLTYADMVIFDSMI